VTFLVRFAGDAHAQRMPEEIAERRLRDMDIEVQDGGKPTSLVAIMVAPRAVLSRP